ncbi:MAG: hypothetical protein EA405_13690 [Rhodospirillales bacterium]|nr:MAG: hypothetical protein EA405_13690 [Rhodospirillales bacterium]
MLEGAGIVWLQRASNAFARLHAAAIERHSLVSTCHTDDKVPVFERADHARPVPATCLLTIAATLQVRTLAVDLNEATSSHSKSSSPAVAAARSRNAARS